jgi:tetratricopeptide (TPR) repeat protein
LCSTFFFSLSIFVRGATAIGTDSGASNFWDKYLEFELQQFASPAVQAQLQLLPPPYTGTIIGGVYAQVLAMPLRDVEKFWTGFSQHFAVNYPLNYLASPQEAELLTTNYPKEVPQDRATFIGPDGTTQTMTLTAFLNEWELEQRRLLLAKREYTFHTSQQLRDEKYPYEHLITRTYFHVAPLPPTDVQAWTGMLDLLESKLVRAFATLQQQQGAAVSATSSTSSSLHTQLDPLLLADTIKSYERCLIPCAGLTDFWDRYANFLSSVGMLEDALKARKRHMEFMRRNERAGVPGAALAIQEVMLAVAELEERVGRIEQARQWLEQALKAAAPAASTDGAAAASITTGTPYLEAILAQIHLERRAWLSAHPASHTFEAGSDVAKLFVQGLEALKNAGADANARAYIHLAMEQIQFTLTSVLFVTDSDRIHAARAMFQSAAEILFPEPRQQEVSAPGPVGADGQPGPATTSQSTVVPRIVASNQFLLFALAWIEFESSIARSGLKEIKEVFELFLLKRPESYTDAIITSNPHLGQRGASGLSDSSRRSLWNAYVQFVEDRAPEVTEVERVRQQAKVALVSSGADKCILLRVQRSICSIFCSVCSLVVQALIPTSSGAPPLLSNLGKRKAASSPLPINAAAAKVARPPHSSGYPAPYGPSGYAAAAASHQPYQPPYAQPPYGQQGGYAGYQQPAYGGYQ